MFCTELNRLIAIGKVVFYPLQSRIMDYSGFMLVNQIADEILLSIRIDENKIFPFFRQIRLGDYT